MRAIRRYVAAVCLVFAVATGSAVAAPHEMTTASKIRSFVRHLLDYLDSKISVPPT